MVSFAVAAAAVVFRSDCLGLLHSSIETVLASDHLDFCVFGKFEEYRRLEISFLICKLCFFVSWIRGTTNFSEFQDITPSSSPTIFLNNSNSTSTFSIVFHAAARLRSGHFDCFSFFWQADCLARVCCYDEFCL